jgi:VWFA-related protein
VTILVLSLVIAGSAAQQPVFRTETRLIIETVTVKDKEGRAIEGLTAKDFAITEDGEPQEIAFVEFQRLDAASTSAPASAADAASARQAPAGTSAPVQAQISAAAAGDIRYRDKRLVVLYFDMTAMGPAEQMRAFAAAQKFLGTMDDSVLMAIMVFEGGAVRVKTDFTSNRAVIAEQILRLIYGDDLDGDGLPDTPESGTAFGQDDYEFNVFNTDRQLSALQTAMSMLRPLPRAQIAGLFLQRAAVERHRQQRAASRDDQRGAASQRVDSRGRRARAGRPGARSETRRGHRPAACRCSPGRGR